MKGLAAGVVAVYKNEGDKNFQSRARFLFSRTNFRWIRAYSYNTEHNMMDS